MTPDNAQSFTYVILESSEISVVDFSLIEEDSINSLRYNLDKTRFVVKYFGDEPTFLSGRTKYNHVEISAIINDYNMGWNEQDPD
jgi:hypothetical protein